MKLSRERKFFVVICALALCALVYDRCFLGGGDEGDAAAADASSLLLGPSAASASPGEKPGGGGGAARKGEDASATSISRVLKEMSERNRLELERTRDAFQPPAGWTAVAPVATTIESENHLRRFAARKLTSVVANSRGEAAAMVDGRIVHVGHTIDGFKLVSVDNQSALFESRGARVRLSLSAEPRIEHLPAGPPLLPIPAGPDVWHDATAPSPSR
jgi:hypothetical protein